MCDKRVIKGNTYALHIPLVSAQQNLLKLRKQNERQKQMIERRKMKEQVIL